MEYTGLHFNFLTCRKFIYSRKKMANDLIGLKVPGIFAWYPYK